MIFSESIARLLDAGFTGVDLPAWIAGGRPRVEKGFAVTFDDGYRSILPGLELLDRARVPATIFLVTRHVGGWNDWPGQTGSIPRAPLLDWSDVLDLSRRGFSLGGHTATHPRLGGLDAPALRRELIESRDEIASRVGWPCRLFAFPYGSTSVQSRWFASRAYAGAFGTRLDVARDSDDIAALPRIDAYYLRSPQVLRRLIGRRLSPWLALRRGLRMGRRAAVSLALARP